MANKVYTISKVSEKPANSLLVYADVNIDASPAPVTFKPVHTDCDVAGTASAKRGSLLIDSLLTDDKGFLQQDILPNEVDKGQKILLTTKLDVINEKNAKFNAIQREKAHYKLEKNVNLIAIKQSIHNIFAWTPGERIINPEFGSKLRSYLYEGITPYNQEQIMAEIRHCFSEWEPRARLDKVINMTDANDRENNTVRIEIQYSVPSLNAYQLSYVYEGQNIA